MEKKSKNKVKSILEKQEVCAFAPNGVSMWPFIKNHKNTVLISSINREIQIYDVIFYQLDNGREILHRVLGRMGEDFLVCGDGLLEFEVVKKDSVFGIMNGFYKGKKFIDARDEKYLKKVSNWYDNPKRRHRKIKRFTFILKVKNKLKLIFKIGKNKNV